jgi:hypothetical protein
LGEAIDGGGGGGASGGGGGPISAASTPRIVEPHLLGPQISGVTGDLRAEVESVDGTAWEEDDGLELEEHAPSTSGRS